MKTHFLIPIVAVLLFAAPANVFASDSDRDSLAKAFLMPSQEAKPQVWWHWMDGNVSYEGIRKDLDWMKRSGIGGFHQFDAGGVNMPRAAKVRLPYLSEGWKDAFRFALNLADSLGLEATIASAPGWSSTGGTWVTPEDAVKKLEWKTEDVTIGKDGKIDIQLPSLKHEVGPFQDYPVGNDRIEVKPYGKDLYVLAVRRTSDDLSMEEMGAQIQSCDTLITCHFSKPQTIKALTLCSYSMGGRPRQKDPIFKNFLEFSEDGEHWTRCHNIMSGNVPYMTEDMTPVKAEWFRVKGEKLVSLELYTVTKVNHFEELGGYSIVQDFGRFHTPWAKKAAKTADVIDLTGKMDADGRLTCSLPSGRWRIYRFGWSITGKVNHPASPEATGLEVDKLDPDAWNRYFHTYLDLYKEASGGMLGPKGIRYLLIDSYEAGSMTWTKAMREEFKARRGYDLLPWMPVLAGEVIGSSEQSEKFLWDWRKTLGELFSENYARVSDIISEYGMAGRYCETHEGGHAYTGDGMDPKIGATIPMAAIWMENTPAGSKIPSAIADIRESSSAAHLYGKKLVAAESFSVCGDEGRAYTYCPENMKYVADIALSAGINRFVIHESASQPNDDYLPGMQLFRYGQWLHRNETWGEYAYLLTDYLARSCSMMQQGRQVSDILLYYGEDSNATAQYGGDTFDTLPQIPSGFDYDFANPTVILSGVQAKDGALVSKGGTSYRILWMDKNCQTMSNDILRRIKEFAEAGVTICGAEPSVCAGLKGDVKEFRKLVKDIWHKGRNNVVSNIDDAISVSGLKPDFKCSVDGFSFVHRSMEDGTQIYWVRNFSPSDVTPDMSFRNGGKNVYVFNAENGKIMELDSDGESVRNLPFKSTDAAFIVLTDNKLDVSTTDSPEEMMNCMELPGEKLLNTIDSPWNAHFEQKGGLTADETFESLCSWTEKSNPVVKYFAGTADFKTKVSINADDLKNKHIALDLGVVKNIAEVIVNGMPAGILWKAPFRTEDIKSLLHEGENEFEIKVTNVWRNRMIGDVQSGETHPVTQIRRFYKATDEVIPSGLLSPAKLVTY